MDMHGAVEYCGRIDQLCERPPGPEEHGYSVRMFARRRKAQALSSALAELDVIAPVEKAMSAPLSVSGDYVSYGFERFLRENFFVLGANDIYGRVKKAPVKKQRQHAEEDIFSDLSPGDFVVHDVHGKGNTLDLKR